MVRGTSSERWSTIGRGRRPAEFRWRSFSAAARARRPDATAPPHGLFLSFDVDYD